MMIPGASDENRLVGERRHPVFFEEELDHVGHDLEQTERSDPVGAVSVLPNGEQPPLEPDQTGCDRDHDGEDAGNGCADDQRASHFGTNLIFASPGTSSHSIPGRPMGTPT